MKSILLVLVSIVVCGCSNTLTTRTCTSNVHCSAQQYCQMTQSHDSDSHNPRQGYCTADDDIK